LALPAQAALIPSARADDEDTRERAAALFREGRDAMERENYATACPKFQESNRLDPAPGTLLNLALCQENLGRLGAALRSYRDVLHLLPGGDERVPFAQEHADSLELRVPRLTLLLPPDAPEGARVLCDGEEVPSEKLGLALPMDPGVHEVVLDIPDQEPLRLSVPLAEGERRMLTLRRADGAVDAPAGSSSLRTVGFIVGGVGAASLAASLITGALVLNKKSTVDEHCDESFCAEQAGIDAASAGNTLATVSTITFFAGIAALGVGAVMVLTSGDAGGATARALRPAPRARGAATVIGPAVFPGGGGLFVGRRF
jgi:hypothetical protein